MYMLTNGEPVATLVIVKAATDTQSRIDEEKSGYKSAS